MDEIAVRFDGVAGIQDSPLMTIAPGIAVLTGRNNVGKSRVLRQIYRLAQSINTVSPSPDTPTICMRSGETRIDVDIRGLPDVTNEPSPRRYQLTSAGSTIAFDWVEEGAPSGLILRRIQNGTVVGRMTMGGLVPVANNGQLPMVRELSDAMARLVYLPPQRVVPATVSTSPLMEPSPGGGDLGQVIYTHRNTVTGQFDEFQSSICDMLPEVSAILTEPTGPSAVTIKLRDRYLGANVSIEDAGTGVSQLLHLVATVIFRPPGRILLVDEPHLHLHPGAQKLLAELVRRHNEHAYVFATHSAIFIRAVEPDAVWLLTRDATGTRIQSAFDERLSRAHILRELGLDAGDISLAERILLVEGTEDVDIYPILLDSIGINMTRANCSVLQLRGADSARPVRDLVVELGRLLNLAFLVILDGDKAGSIEKSEHVTFLPVPEIENYLTRDAAAVRRGFLDVLSEQEPENVDIEEWSERWTVEHVAEFIQQRVNDQPTRKGSSVLGDLAHEMKLRYTKTLHGPRIAQYVRGEHVEELREVVAPLLQS